MQHSLPGWTERPRDGSSPGRFFARGENTRSYGLGLLKGRKTACFPPITGDMENAGATVVDAPDVVDGNLVSCRGWPDMPLFGRAMMDLFTKSVSSSSA